MGRSRSTGFWELVLKMRMPTLGWEVPGRKILVALAIVFVSGPMLSACGQNGEATKPGGQILQDTAAALRSAHSYRLQGVVPVSGGSGRFTFEVQGPNVGSGVFTLGSTSFQLEEVRGTDYVKSKTLWESADGGALQGLLANKWVSIPANNPLAQALTSGLAALTSAKQEAATILKGEAGARRGRVRSFAGQGVVEVLEGTGGSVLVATSGTPFPLRVQGQGPDYVDLSDFNQAFGISAPKGAISLTDVIAGLGAGFGPGGSRN